MADRHDDVDAWLSQHIEPLPPPPGTFEAIRRRARRRKYRRLAVSAGAALVIVAAGLTVPQVVRLPIEKAQPEAGPSALRSASSHPATTGSAGVESSRQAQITLPPGNPVPANFQPTSVTAVSRATVFTIGQAGTPGHCATQYCTSMARSQNAGATWTGLPAPVTGAPDGASGVGQVRFLEGVNGWAFGPELWATHNGGDQWTKVSTHGRRVTDVEAVAARAFAIEATCTGAGQDFAAQCTSFTLYSTPAKADAWTKVGAVTTNLTPPDNGTGAAALVLTGSRGYLLGPDGTLYSGPVDGSAAWHAAGKLPCATGQAQADGAPAGALLGAVTAQNLLLTCAQAPAGTRQVKQVYVSSDGGKAWQKMWTAPAAGIATSIAASPSNTVLLATTEGIEVLPAQASSWRPASLAAQAPPSGFGFVGMTTAVNGMALPADPSAGTVWFTTDGGLTWVPHPVRGG